MCLTIPTSLSQIKYRCCVSGVKNWTIDFWSAVADRASASAHTHLGSAARTICHLQSVICNQAQRGAAAFASPTGLATKGFSTPYWQINSSLFSPRVAVGAQSLRSKLVPCMFLWTLSPQKNSGRKKHKDHKERTPTKPLLVNSRLHAARPKLNRSAHGTQRFQARRSKRVRCCAWLGAVSVAQSASVAERKAS